MLLQKKILLFFNPSEFKCAYGLPADTDLVTSKLLHDGYQLGPCLGRKSLNPEQMPTCPNWKVLVWDHELTMNQGRVEMVTKIKVEKPANEKTKRLIFSKDVSVEMITVCLLHGSICIPEYGSYILIVHFFVALCLSQIDYNIDLVEPGPSNRVVLFTFQDNQAYAEFTVTHIHDEQTDLCVYDSMCGLTWTTPQAEMEYMTAVQFQCTRAMEFLMVEDPRETEQYLMYECQWDSTFTGGNGNVTLPNCTCT